MAQTTVNFRMDEDLKKEMEKTCDELGMTMTTAFIIFAKKMSRERRIPFEVSVESSFRKDLMEALEEVEEMEKHPEKYKRFHSVKELMEDLNDE